MNASHTSHCLCTDAASSEVENLPRMAPRIRRPSPSTHEPIHPTSRFRNNGDIGPFSHGTVDVSSLLSSQQQQQQQLLPNVTTGSTLAKEEDNFINHGKISSSTAVPTTGSFEKLSMLSTGTIHPILGMDDNTSCFSFTTTTTTTTTTSSPTTNSFPMPRLHKKILSPYSKCPSDKDDDDHNHDGTIISSTTFVNLALKLAKKGSESSKTMGVFQLSQTN
jgi:hypothetical protein